MINSQAFGLIVGAASVLTSCISPLQEYVAFGKAPVYPTVVPTEVGEIVPFEVRPPVPLGSVWSLACKGRVRFADDPTSSSLDWTASPRAVHLETIVSPWDPLPPSERTSHEWLWYGMRDEGESSVLDRELPLRRAAYRELAPVTFAATYAPGAEKPELTVTQEGGRVIARYRTPTEKGTPHAPVVDAMLLETGHRTLLYAEVRSNFGAVGAEPIGYDVSLSYDMKRVESPAEIVVVGWVGHGDYWKPFTVTRSSANGAPPSTPPGSIPPIPSFSPPKATSAPTG